MWCQPLVVPSATLLCICWRTEPCVPVVCVVWLLLLRASRDYVSLLLPRPACLSSFSCAVNSFLQSTRPHAAAGLSQTLMGSVEAGCCLAASEFQLHNIFLIIVCNFLYSSSRDPTSQLDITPCHSGVFLTFTPVNLLLGDCLPFGWRV